MSGLVLPCLLQTPEYAAARNGATPTPGEFVGERVDTRMKRQGLLGGNPPPRLSAVIDESVLRRPIGGPEVMHRQRLRLLELSQRPETAIRVLPLSVGAPSGVERSIYGAHALTQEEGNVQRRLAPARSCRPVDDQGHLRLPPRLRPDAPRA